MLTIEFGSSRRGDFDLTSDRDLLLIASDWEQITSETAKKTTEGYSVSAFLFDKAAYLIKSGSLFFKHICDEGVLVSGSEKNYRELFSGWRAAADYRDELYENIDLLEVIRFAPATPAGVAAIVDILISSVRNILIRRLACSGKYVFSWRNVLAAAEKRDIIKAEDVRLLLMARHFKNCYRQGIVASLPMTYLDALLEASSRACGIPLRLQFATRAELRLLPEKYGDRSYKQLRAVELMCAEYYFDSALKPLMTFVRRPAYFCANGPGQ